MTQSELGRMWVNEMRPETAATGQNTSRLETWKTRFDVTLHLLNRKLCKKIGYKLMAV